MTQEQLAVQLHENRVEADIGQTIVEYYPGWRWWIECTLMGGIVSIYNQNLDGKHGYVLHLGPYLNATASDRKLMVMRAGGEILERHGLKAGKRPEKIEVERDFKGDAIGDKDATS